MKDKLETRENKEISTEFIVKLMDIILNNNIFEFHDALWKHRIGAAMGSRPVSSYADIFMAAFEKKIRQLSQEYNEEKSEALKLFKRFLDDYLQIFVGTTKKLHQFFKEVNKINPTIQLTMTHTTIDGEATENKCSCNNRTEIPFLDTLLKIKNARVDIDFHKKETDRNQYLLLSSCHSKETTLSIPYSLSLIIVRVCTSEENREKQFLVLKKCSLQRGYLENNVNSAIDKARKIPRAVALRKVKETVKSEGPIFAVTYDPRHPALARADPNKTLEINDQ